MKKLLILTLLVATLAGCNSSKNVLYMQDVKLNEPVEAPAPNVIKVRPGDMLSISVTCRNPELAAMFNPTEVYRNNNSSEGSIGNSNSAYSIGISNQNGSNNSLMPYLVDDKGNIDFPVLGDLHVEGLTRSQIADLIKQRIIAGNYLEDPRVNVTFMNLHYTVLGDVSKPGVNYIKDDKVTLLDAIAQAGDLNITGRRDRVLVTRTTDGKQETHLVDLRSTDLFNSPVYYIQQDDVVYVEPNNVRAGQSSVNENNFKSVSMWMSIASFLMSLTVFIFK